jgi:hypothetical protein
LAKNKHRGPSIESKLDHENLLYPTDSEETLHDIKKWIDGGAKINLSKTTDTDVLRVIFIELQKRVKTGDQLY